MHLKAMSLSVNYFKYNTLYGHRWIRVWNTRARLFFNREWYLEIMTLPGWNYKWELQRNAELRIFRRLIIRWTTNTQPLAICAIICRPQSNCDWLKTVFILPCIKNEKEKKPHYIQQRVATTILPFKRTFANMASSSHPFVTPSSLRTVEDHCTHRDTFQVLTELALDRHAWESKTTHTASALSRGLLIRAASFVVVCSV